MLGKFRTGWDPCDTFFRVAYLINKKYDVVHCVDTRPNVVIPGMTGLAIVESFCASKLGSMAEIVKNGITSLHFNPGNPTDLAY